MKDLIAQFLCPKTRFKGGSDGSTLKKDVLLFDESAVAQEIAFMLGGQWDGCNGVVVQQCDEVAVNTAASLVGAKWCYGGATAAILERFPANQLLRRYAAGERYFINANLRCEQLSFCILREINLSSAQLSWANFSEANLSSADFTAADLSDANLRDAKLSQANLSRTNLTRANLVNANLTGASLNKACLIEANLSGADLRGANLSLATLRGTDLRGANLAGVQLNSAELTRAILSDETVLE